MSSNRYESGVPLPLDSVRGKKAHQYYHGKHLQTNAGRLHSVGYFNGTNSCINNDSKKKILYFLQNQKKKNKETMNPEGVLEYI